MDFSEENSCLDPGKGDGGGGGWLGTLNSPSDGDGLRILRGLKFFILEFFG